MIYRDIVDSLPAAPGGGQMVVSTSPNYQAVCVNSSGGIISNNSGYNSLSYESSDGSGATVPPAPTAGATQWSVPGNTIIPAGTCRFSFDVTLPRAGTYKNVIPANIRTSGGNDADGAQASITAFAGPTVTKAYSPKSILGDGKATSTLTITLNNSSPAAVSLTAPLTDNIGNGLEITGVTTSCPGTATFSGTTITYPSGATLNPGTCTITATVRSATAGSYPNTISAGALQTTVGNNAAAASDTLTVTSFTRLTITKTHASQNFTAGQTGTYTVTVSNASGAAATSGALSLSDLLPSGMSFNSVTTTAGGSFGTRPASGATGRVDWTFTPSTPLAAGQSLTFTVTVNVANTVANGATLTNYASVGGGGDPDVLPTPGATCTGEQCASDPTTVNRITQLTLRKEFPQGAAGPKGFGNYDYATITISQGSSTLTTATTSSIANPGPVATDTINITPGANYTLREVLKNDAVFSGPDSYDSRYTCTNATTGSTTVMPTNSSVM